MNFSRGQATGKIENKGELTAAEGGMVALLAPEITNDGLVSAQMGNVIMAGGDRVSLDAGMNGMLKVAVDGSTVDSLIENRQMVKADGGQVIMTSKAANELVSSVITNKGTVQARTMVEKDGRILLLADMDHGQVQQQGLIDAGAPISGDGGFVETSAAKVKVADGSRVTTKAEHGKTGTWLIDPNDYTIAASGGDITGAQLSSDLDSNNVEILSTAGSNTDGNGDIHVNDAVSWNKNKLTLTAERDININAVMTASSTAQLEMNTGADDGVKVGIDENTGEFKGRVDFGTRTGAGFLTINNQDYTVINDDISALQNISLSGYYALGGDIDASDTENWDGGAGFNPIGTSSSIAFTGTFNGLGHIINDLTINRPGQSDVGLFGYINRSKISNVGLEGVSITGNDRVGGLVGYNYQGRITDSYSTGQVTGNNYVGGLVGYNLEGAITESYATGDVTGTDRVGGLVGSNTKGHVSASHAIGAVEGNTNVGGLVGRNTEAHILDSSAAGTVKGNSRVGGLAGRNDRGVVSASFATGDVFGSGTDSQYLGGLVGRNSGSITESFATGDIQGNDQIGGLAGRNSGSITASYATGQVSGVSRVGGLAGLVDNGEITNSRAEGEVTGTEDYVGGLVGYNTQGQIIDGSASGRVSGLTQVGGLVGRDEGGTISTSSATGQVSGTNQVGGLVGLSVQGQINESRASGAVSGQNRIGGLVGDSSSDITNSRATGQVSGASRVGGLAGFIDNGEVTNSHAEGEVTGTQDHVGGLVGYSNQGQIVDSSAIGPVSGLTQVGGLVGRDEGGTISRSSASGQVSGTSQVGGLVGYSNQGQINESRASGAVSGQNRIGGLVGDSSSDITNSRATGQVSGVSRVGGLAGFIDNGEVTNSHAEGEVTGTQDHVGGLVGYSNQGQIMDSTAIGPVSGLTQVGGLVGRDEGGTISRSSASGPVSGTSQIGGLVGYNKDGNIVNSRAEGDVTGTANYVGGLVGWKEKGSISGSSATGTVSGLTQVGGLVGRNEDGTISTSSASGQVSGTSNVGGLVGRNEKGSISGSIATGMVSGTSQLGGLVGYHLEGTISDSHATGSVTGTGIEIGGLVGITTGDIVNSHATGDVLGANRAGGLAGFSGQGQISGSTATGAVSGGDRIGGLVGFSKDGDIVNSHAEGDVTGSHHGGGLVGWKEEGSISGSTATGTVSGLTQVGGLVGRQENGSISTSSASGQVSGTSNVGGLVGRNEKGSISGSIATGMVSGTSQLGGLVGYHLEGTISDSHATGSVTGTGNEIGGLAGATTGDIANSHATGDVLGADRVGGLAGFSQGQIKDSRATGAVSGQNRIGGLVGYNYQGQLTNSFAIGLVTGTGSRVGGLVGENTGSVSSSFWDINTSGQTNSAGGEGKTTTEMKTMATFTDAGWDISALGGENTIWRIYAGNTYPLLRYFLTPQDISPITHIPDATKTYDGLEYTTSLTIPGLDNDHVFCGAGVHGINAGAHDTMIYSDQQGYDFIGGPTGTLTVNPVDLTVTIKDILHKVYDGNQIATLTPDNYEIIGWITGESGQITKTDGEFDSKDAGNRQVIVHLGAGDYQAGSGTILSNYSLVLGDVFGSGLIDPASLTITANDHAKTYDGLAYSGGNGVSFSGFVAGETESVLGGTLTYGGDSQGARDAGTYSISPGGYRSTNYVLNYVDGTLTISPAALTAILTGAVQKTYDGSKVATLAPGNYVLTGWQGSDGAQVTKTSGVYDSPNAGANKMVTVSLLDTDYTAIGTTNLSNYYLPTTISGNVGVIDPAGLTITANDHAKTYDGLAYSGGNGVSFSGFVPGETVGVLGGALTYAGDSQGAIDAGTYTLTPGGYSSTNYSLKYVDGRLVISVLPAPLPGTGHDQASGGTLWVIKEEQERPGPQDDELLLSFAPDFIRMGDTEEEEENL